MERGFQSLLLAGKAAAGDDNFSPLAYSDEAYINRNMSFQAFIFDKPLLSLMPYPYGSLYDSNTLDCNLRSRITGESSKEESKWRCIEREEKLKRPKPEPEQFNFNPTNMFGQLPGLQSLEQENEEKRRFKQSFSPIATTTNPHLLEPSLTQFQFTAPNYTAPVPLRQIKPPIPPPAKLSVRDQARKRRNTLSDKARTLQKVLPWDKKMDMATIYEETYKYIKFLQAQISVLQSMPVASSSSSPLRSENPRQRNQFGGLGKLNRQQLLEVLVNSPAAQTILYSKGCCIYSLEQLILFKDIAEKNFFISGHSMFS